MVQEFNDVVTALFSGEAGEYIYDGDAHSFPIIGKRNGKIVDCFFLFSFLPEVEQFTLPFAQIIIDAETGELVYYAETDTDPLILGDTQESYHLQFQYSGTEREVAYETYIGIYAYVRQFAFQENIGLEERMTLSLYINSISALTAIDMKQFYRALSPDFFEWAMRMLEF